jgi:hypothetical protein
MMLPEMQEKNGHTCIDCRYFVTIIGRQECKACCIRSIGVYGRKGKNIPSQIDIYEILRYVSPTELIKLVENSPAGKIACGDFQHRI